MISGGLGALGSLMASWLCLSGAKHLLLLSRSGHAPGQGTLLQSLLSSLQLVTVARCAKCLMLCKALALPSLCTAFAGKKLHARIPRRVPYANMQGGHRLSR